MLRILIISLIAAGPYVGASNRALALDEFSSALVLPPRSSMAVKWRLVQTQMNDDAIRLAVCRADAEACSIEDKRFEEIIDAGRARDRLARIGEINRSINLTIRPMSDVRRFGVRDHWSAPLQTLRDGVGDCEDYAILKYLALREAGVAASDLEFLILRDPVRRADHAVVAVRHDDRWIVLDNRTMVLADLQSTLQIKRYRVLAQFGRDGDAQGYATLALPTFDMM
jgi:predicted transglutaminase-like cysteine proteinase